MFRSLLAKISIITLLAASFLGNVNSATAAIALVGSAEFAQSPTAASLWSTTYSVGAGANRILFVQVNVYNPSAGSTITVSVTYAGAPMTRIGTVQEVVDPGTEVNLFYIVNPPSGSNTVEATLSGSRRGEIFMADYSGASQTGVPDSTAQENDGGGSISIGTTVVAADSWTIMAGGTVSATAAATFGNGSGTTIRQDATQTVGGVRYSSAFADSNGPLSPGSNSLTITVGASQTGSGGIIASFAPAGDAPPVVARIRGPSGGASNSSGGFIF